MIIKYYNNIKKNLSSKKLNFIKIKITIKTNLTKIRKKKFRNSNKKYWKYNILKCSNNKIDKKF